MASKTVTVSADAAAAGCTATCDSYATGSEYGIIDFTNYQIVATAAAGWRLVSFTFDEHTQSSTGASRIAPYTVTPDATGKYPADADKSYSSRLAPFEDDYVDGAYHEWTTLENVSAVFVQDAPTTYTITTAVSPAGAGSVTGGGQYSSGTTVTLQALPSAGYGVAYWQKDGVMVQGSERQSSLSITVTSNATYTAALQTETKVTVTLVATDFGLVHFKDDSAAPSQGPIIKTFTKGSMYSDTFTVEAITKNGSVFKYWTISGLSGKWYDAELYRYAPDEDTTITAYFALPIEAYARQFDNKLIPADY